MDSIRLSLRFVKLCNCVTIYIIIGIPLTEGVQCYIDWKEGQKYDNKSLYETTTSSYNKTV